MDLNEEEYVEKRQQWFEEQGGGYFYTSREGGVWLPMKIKDVGIV